MTLKSAAITVATGFLWTGGGVALLALTHYFFKFPI